MTTEQTPPPIAGALRTTGSQPTRPSLITSNYAPVVAKVPPPLPVRVSEFFWILSLAAGAVGIVYAFIIRADQVEHIAERVRGVDATRAEETVTTTADIIYWSMFGTLVAIVLLQILLVVSFANRRPRARWWLLATVLLQAVALIITREFADTGATADPLKLILIAQGALAALGLLWSLLPVALRWTARGVDIRRGPDSFSTGGDV